MRLLALPVIGLAALYLAACGSSGTVSSPPSSAATQAAAPSSAAIPDTGPNQGLCKLVQTQVQVDAEDSATAQQATLDLINAALQIGGPSSTGLKGLVSTWALAVSTDLSSGEPPTYNAGPSLQAVAQACDSIGVTVPTS